MFLFVYSLACEQAKDINVQLCQSLRKTNKISKSRMRKSRKEKKSKISEASKKSEFSTRPLPECFFKVRCKMSSDASNHELIKIDHKESIRCHILKYFEISWVH